MKEATDPEARAMIAEFWNAKEAYAAASNPVDIQKARKRQYQAAAWIGGGVDLRPFYGRIPTLDQLDERRRRENNRHVSDR